jgi:hypothetical protein
VNVYPERKEMFIKTKNEVVWGEGVVILNPLTDKQIYGYGKKDKIRKGNEEMKEKEGQNK